MTYDVLRPSMQALALAASLALVAPTGAAALPVSSPMTVAATAGAHGFVTPAAWLHHRYWRHRGYGWGPGAAFAAAALGIIGLGIANANAYDYSYACDPYNDDCGPYYGGYAYGYPYGYGHGGGFHHFHGMIGPRFGGGPRIGGMGAHFAHAGRSGGGPPPQSVHGGRH
ncbi:MAG: hypothetical protein ABR929_07155 [Roseiarcus sp.]|jgi:hypothetical protein